MSLIELAILTCCAIFIWDRCSPKTQNQAKEMATDVKDRIKRVIE